MKALVGVLWRRRQPVSLAIAILLLWVGSATAQRFVDNGDGTITDTQTALQWEKKTGTPGGFTDCSITTCPDPHDVNNTYQWCLDANHDYSCDNGEGPADGGAFIDFLGKLNSGSCFAGECDWRLPTIDELQGILLAPYQCPNNPCIDQTFGPTQGDVTWSSTTDNSIPSFAWYVSFYDGYATSARKPNLRWVRAVRSLPTPTQTPMPSGPTPTPVAATDVLRCEGAVAVQSRRFWKKVWHCHVSGAATDVSCIASARDKAAARLLKACSDAVARQALGEPAAQAAIDRALFLTEQDATRVFDARFGQGMTTSLAARVAANDTLRAGQQDVKVVDTLTKNSDQCLAQDRQRAFLGKGSQCNVPKAEEKNTSAVDNYVATLARIPGQANLIDQLQFHLPLLISNPTCQQDLALRAYLNGVDPILTTGQRMVWSSINATSTAQEVIDNVITITDSVRSLAGVYNMTADQLLLTQGSALGDLFGTEFDSTSSQVAAIWVDLVLSCAQALEGDVISCSAALTSKSFTALVNWKTAFSILDLTQRMNEYMLAAQYLTLYYQYGGDPVRLGLAEGAASSSLQDIVATFGYQPYVWYRPFQQGVYDLGRLTSLVGAGQTVVGNVLTQNVGVACGSMNNTATATPPGTPTASAGATASATATATGTATATRTGTATVMGAPTGTATSTRTPTGTSTRTPANTATATATASGTATGCVPPPPPTPFTPPNGTTTTDTTPDLAWLYSGTVNSFWIQVDNNAPNFTSPEAQADPWFSSNYTPTLPYGTYGWRVRSRGPDGCLSAWSTVFYFTIVP